MKVILVVPAVGLLFSGLTFLPKSLPIPASAVPAVPSTDIPSVWVDKNECYKDETFDLHFNLPHATSLGVVDPSGNFFYLVFPEACTSGNLKPLVSSENFSELTTLSICPATLRADPYTYGVADNQPVFTKSGVYRFILGENLHVDDESVLKIVSVRYRHHKRPASTASVKP